jgi:uncharacterized membrane protein YdjX (TVP38/TMEM64 family)
LVAGLIGVGFWLPTTTKFRSILAWIRNLSPIYSSLAFASVQALLTVLFLPGALFVLMAGFTLGLWLGTLVAWTGSVLGAIGAFLVGRQLIAERVRRWAVDSPFFTSVLKAIDSADEGWKITILLRLSPLMPYALINYLLSSTQLSLWTYSWTSALGVLPPTALYVYLGTTAASLSDILGDAFSTPEAEPVTMQPDGTPAPAAPSEAPSAMDTTQLWVMGIGVVITIAVAVLVTIFTSRAIKRASRLGSAGGSGTALVASLDDAILEGSSGSDDDEGGLDSLNHLEDDTENSVQLKELGSLHLSSRSDRSSNAGSPTTTLSSSINSETELLDHRSGSLHSSKREDRPSLDSDSDDDHHHDILSLPSSRPGLHNDPIISLDAPFNISRSTNSRLSLADSHASV